MPVINNQTFYRTNEVCKIAGISKATLFRWIKKKTCSDAEYRDKRGWRLFTEGEIDKLKLETNKIISNI